MTKSYEGINMSENNQSTKETLVYELLKLWQDEPELRLTQLLMRIIKPEPHCPEIYFLEDSELRTLIKERHEIVQKEKLKDFFNSMRI